MRCAFLVMAFFGLAACSDGPVIPTIPLTAPLIRGTIRGPGDLGSLLVVSGVDSGSCDAHRRAQVQVGRASLFRRTGGQAVTSDLKVGIVVSVWTTGLSLDTCPAIFTATTVVIEDAEMGSQRLDQAEGITRR